MGILGVPVHHGGEVLHSLLVIVNHLVCLGPLVHKSNIVGVALDAPAVRPNRLFKLLHTAIGQPNVVIDVGLYRDVRLILECFFQFLDALLVFLVRVISQA